MIEFELLEKDCFERDTGRGALVCFPKKSPSDLTQNLQLKSRQGLCPQQESLGAELACSPLCCLFPSHVCCCCC